MTQKHRISRRLFFGAATGAAVAPMLASETAVTAPPPPPYPPPYYGDQIGSALTPRMDPDYMRHLQRKARGQFTVEEEEQFRTNGPCINQADNIEALRSVSAGQKSRMRAAYYASKERERWIGNAKRELAQMAKRGLGL